jgi:hypothetical protein
MGNNTLLGTIPKVAIDIEGFVAGIYEAEMGLINTMRGETHTFSEMTEYPKRGGTVFGLSYDEHTTYRKMAWREHWKSIPRYVEEPILLRAAQEWDSCWVTAAGDSGIMESIRKWLGYNYNNVDLPIIQVPTGSDKSLLDFDVFLDDAPRLAYRIAEIYEGSRLPELRSGHMRFERQKSMIIPRWPYTPNGIEGIAPSHILRVAPGPSEAFTMAREMTHMVGERRNETVMPTKLKG